MSRSESVRGEMRPAPWNNYSIICLFKGNMIIGNSFVYQGDFKEHYSTGPAPWNVNTIQQGLPCGSVETTPRGSLFHWDSTNLSRVPRNESVRGLSCSESVRDEMRLPCRIIIQLSPYLRVT